MKIDWAQVKKKTLWQYEDLIKKMLIVLNYGFVQENYSHTMPEATAYSERIRRNYLQNGKEPTFISEITEHFKRLDNLGIKNYLDLVQQVDTKGKCQKFLEKTGFRFDALVQVLGYLFRWVLPFKCPIKELLDTISKTDITYVEILKRYRIRFNLDVLEDYRTKASRAKFSRETGVAEESLLELVHRADISRIAYVRGKTIKHLCGGGYNTLNKLADADIKKMEADMTEYYATIGKSFSDFKTVIPLDWMIGGANTLPRLVEA
jgi:hypothetical protein